MVFTSPLFLFVFLPAAWLLWMAAGRLTRDARASLAVLAIVSLVFYAWWHVPNLLVLGASVAGNFLLGQVIAATAGRTRTWLVSAGVAANLAMLGVFKYYGFLTGDRIPLVLPLAISFFTFTQIAFLVDVSRGEVRETNFLRYLTFVVFFPHLIAGPIVRLQEIQEQLRACVPSRLRFDDFHEGARLILIGLAKKTLIADTLAPSADLVFTAAQNGAVTAPLAWIGTACFYLQIYFDFSGYTDIALGVARLFTIQFPQNFAHPYRATSVIDFWHRWHMTLSRFLRDYLYIPLGGSRGGEVRRYVNLMITMLLGGLWHGAGWTFVVWGGLHGAALSLNHLVRRHGRHWPLPPALKWIAVQGFVFVAWIFFRAADFPSAWRVISGLAAPWRLADPRLPQLLAPTDAMLAAVTAGRWAQAGVAGLLLVVAAGLIAAVWDGRLPRSREQALSGGWMHASLRMGLAALVLALLSYRVAAGNVIQPFIYFQF